MIRKSIYLLLFFLVTLSVNAQQLHFHSQYMFNPYLHNPAFAGSKDYTVLTASFRNQWTGFTDAPRTGTLSGHFEVADNMGLGIALYSDQTGPTSRTGGMASYAFHIDMGKSILSFGLSGMVFQYSLDKTLLTTDVPGDLAIQGEMVSRIVPEATFGMLFRSDEYWIGVAVPQLIQMKVDIGPDNFLNKMTRHYYVSGGYKFDVADDLELEPSLMLKATTAAPIQLDLNLRTIYNKMMWLGFSYRTGDAAVAMLGMEKGKISFGYSYDITLTNIKSYSSGSHEIFVGYRIGWPKTGKAMLD
ncbi:MAG: type IX secretion system membrane protein PorP/SprF [Flavobacteriales bacterium]|nr:type IX secretion system membrane protein PorP/SprF [Flavobacteriales bacterium]